MKRWSKNEILLLRKLWSETSKSDLIHIFKDRTWRSLERKAEKIGIRRLSIEAKQYTEIKSWIEGEMLGDGHVDLGGRYSHTTIYPFYATFLKDKFNEIGISVKIYEHSYTDKRTNKTYKRSILKTRSFFKIYRERWYFGGNKIVPDDIIVNDSVFLHWFLGDGTINKRGHGMSLATMGFDPNKVGILRRKLMEYGLDNSITKKNNIYILKTKKSVRTLNDFLQNADYPECYSYKFDRLKLWLNKFRGRNRIDRFYG
jgi:hypothetical protein